MGTTVLNISSKLGSLIVASAEEEVVASAADWLVTPAKREIRSREDAKLEAALLQGIESGDPTPLTEQDWRDLHSQLEEHITGLLDRQHAA